MVMEAHNHYSLTICPVNELVLELHFTRAPPSVQYKELSRLHMDRERERGPERILAQREQDFCSVKV